jgi:hypothetical protein
MAETMLVVGTLCLVGLLNIMVILVLLDMRRVLTGNAVREKAVEQAIQTDEVYAVTNIGEEEAISEAEAQEVAAIFRMSRHAASPDEIIAGILREDAIREKRAGD